VRRGRGADPMKEGKDLTAISCKFAVNTGSGIDAKKTQRGELRDKQRANIASNITGTRTQEEEFGWLLRRH